LFCEDPVARSGQKFSELLNITSFHKISAYAESA